MNEELLKVIRQLKDEILFILTSYNMTDETHAQAALDKINALFDKLGIVIEDVIPPIVMQSYLAGTGGATLGASLYAVTELTDNVMLDLKAAIRTAKMNTNQSIVQALSSVQEDLRIGVINASKKRKVTAKVAESFAENGMTSFVTSDGKSLTLEYYSEVVTRTNMQMAEVKGSIDWIADNGNDLVIVNGVTPTCGHCYAHRGVVFSISGKDKRFQPLKGNSPPYHPNCMCYVELYDEDSMDQRYVEADIEKSLSFEPKKDNRPENIKKAYDKRQARLRRENYEKKRYAKIAAVVGEENMPANLAAFRRMKRSNTANYKKLLKTYKAKLKEGDQ